jgi:oxidoreductase
MWSSRVSTNKHYFTPTSRKHVRYVQTVVQHATSDFQPLLQTGKSAAIIGATGQVGRHVLQHLLSSSEFTRVGEYGRRVTSADQITTGKEKLEQKVIDFEKIEESGLKAGKWDVVYITYARISLKTIVGSLKEGVLFFIRLGTTRAAVKSDAEFEKIDREWVC